jgi:hypothetical protein
MKTQKVKTPDVFKLFDNRIEVTSSSGNKYEITLDYCTCKGFSFHRECRHYQEAEKQGLILQLETKINEFSGITLCDHARVIRKDAIRQYLTKHNTSFTEEIINKIESILTCSTTPQEVLSLCVKIGG